MKMSTLAVAAALTTGGISAFAAEQAQTGETQEAKAGAEAVKGKPFIYQFHAGDAGLLNNPIHQRNYWKLLVQAYAPETASAWTSALEERKQLEASLPAADAGHVVTFKGRLPDGVELSEQPEDPQNTLRIQIDKSGNNQHIAKFTDPSGNVISMPTTDILKLQEKPEQFTIHKEPAPEIQRLIKLNEAVEANDAEAIRTLLPQLLEDYRKQTAELKEDIEQLKALKAVSTETDTKAEK
ncbi:hypothetical protein D3P08_26050 [Paenibacillus nanensis]|uniref:Uncharacterized protein n=2 Tax=Paenibacillus nanensis TaxID=393251 RepID=A0A3A1UJ23_9BACL|nr:hypothetical protein D3P08_26050 [Paenibacillus nanensis]